MIYFNPCLEKYNFGKHQPISEKWNIIKWDTTGTLNMWISSSQLFPHFFVHSYSECLRCCKHWGTVIYSKALTHLKWCTLNNVKYVKFIHIFTMELQGRNSGLKSNTQKWNFLWKMLSSYLANKLYLLNIYYF